MKEPIVAQSALGDGLTEDEILHAYRNPMRAGNLRDRFDGMLRLLDPATRLWWRTVGRPIDLGGEHAWLDAPISAGSLSPEHGSTACRVPAGEGQRAGFPASKGPQRRQFLPDLRPGTVRRPATSGHLKRLDGGDLVGDTILRQLDLVAGLQVQPELGIDTEVLAQA